MKYKEKIFKNNIKYHEVTDEKFKTNLCDIYFTRKINEVKTSDIAIASDYISSCTEKYNSISALNSKLNMLYGANLYSSISKRGDVFLMNIGISFIDEKFIPEKSQKNEELNILFDSITKPFLVDGEFDKNIFELKKKDLLDDIKADINDKRRYLFLKSSKYIYKDEPASLPLYGNEEDAKAVNPKSAYEIFCDFINNSEINIFYSGVNDKNSEVIEELAKNLPESKKIDGYISPSGLKSELLTKKETIHTNQSKFLLSYKINGIDRYTMSLLAIILGGTPTSKLFLNVREKQSLCYYCACSYVYSKSTLIIDCGVEKENIEKAKKAIEEQVDEIINGNISDTEMFSAMQSIVNSAKAIGDTVRSYNSWISSCEFNNEIITPEEMLEKYQAVTKEQISKVANDLVPDTFYVLESE